MISYFSRIALQDYETEHMVENIVDINSEQEGIKDILHVHVITF